jgi:hypothetical protein
VNIWEKELACRLDIESWELLSNFERISVLDSIDFYNANTEYLKLMEMLKCDQRIIGLKKCLAGKYWNFLNFYQKEMKISIQKTK